MMGSKKLCDIKKELEELAVNLKADIGVKAKEDVWVVQHAEVYAVDVDGHIGYVHDHVVFRIVSSIKAARDFVKKQGVSPYSWWKISPYPLDDDEYDNRQAIYCNYKGKQVDSPPIVSAIKAYKKAKKTEKFLEPMKISQ